MEEVKNIMVFELNIETVNNAFGESNIEKAEEIKRILKRIIKDLDRDDIGQCRDINGNLVGSWVLS